MMKLICVLAGVLHQAKAGVGHPLLAAISPALLKT